MEKGWSKIHIKRLLEMYRDRPCLWKINHEHYTNKNEKIRAYDEIVRELHKWFPQADRSLVKMKIQNMRCSYRKELKKKTAAEGMEEYIPALWYFDLLDFTRDQQSPHSSSTSSRASHKNESILQDIPDEDPFENVGAEESEEAEELDSQTDVFFREPLPRDKRVRTDRQQPSHFIQNYPATLSTPPNILDDCAALGTYVSEKLRKMDDSQQILAEALIQKVITKGLKNQLTDGTDLNETFPSQAMAYRYHARTPIYPTQLESPQSDISPSSSSLSDYCTKIEHN